MEINAQIVLERAGFQIIGIVPASDRLMVAPGVIKRVYEAMYVKVLAADADVLREPRASTSSCSRRKGCNVRPNDRKGTKRLQPI
jgi:hypothetical protein